MGHQQSIGHQSLWAKRLFLLLTVSFGEKRSRQKKQQKKQCSWPHFGAWRNIFIAVVRVESLYLEYREKNPTGDGTPPHLWNIYKHMLVSASSFLYIAWDKGTANSIYHWGVTGAQQPGWKSTCVNPDFALKLFHAWVPCRNNITHTADICCSYILVFLLYTLSENRRCTSDQYQVSQWWMEARLLISVPDK